MDDKSLSQIFEGTLKRDPLGEILHLAKAIDPAFDLGLLIETHNDLTNFFSGSHPDYQRNTLPYHNLRHSMMVVLATTRLFHGLQCNKVTFSSNTLLKGIMAAYFHDSGMLLLEDDPAPSGTKYIANHEARSIQFLENYIKEKTLDKNFANDCAIIINYTDLENDPNTFEPHSHEVQLAGQVVGSADILAQMADRYYLECLPLLFKEQKAGGVNQHTSALELMEHTANFYHNVVLKRLVTTFSNTSQVMQDHFRERFAVNRNLYIENIDKNIAYLKRIIKKCEDLECIENYLKRNPPKL